MRPCGSAGGHYNPHNTNHGSYLLGGERHAGDMINNLQPLVTAKPSVLEKYNEMKNLTGSSRVKSCYAVILYSCLIQTNVDKFNYYLTWYS